ncbi:glycosyltransferase [Treponema bryantii]|uniref:glycosyltransferase n=1 Tax=Treponema bryantii TaxID=163 RepID=UPI0003B3C151|nr:glycosyltransferase [Treponema bryantii]
MNTLFISTNGIKDTSYGGPKGSIRNYLCLKDFGTVIDYTISKKSNIRSLLSLLQGFYPPLDYSDIKKIKKILKTKKIDLVFFDGSVNGNLVSLCKNIKTVVFYHNCEKDFISVRFGNKRNIKKFIYKIIVTHNEKKITQKANCRIVFSERDKKRIESLYNKTVDLIIPLGMEDKYSTNVVQTEDTVEKYCLLFGAVCEANIEGYSWFVKKVSPFIKCNTIIAGRGFEKFKDDFESQNVKVFGFVDDFSKLYSNAAIVGIPLFSGGGMKVKTVEALMFGKKIIGTDEAFSGFNQDVVNNNMCCNTATDFVDAINTFIDSNSNKFDKRNRELFEKYYSVESSKQLFLEMKKILGV